MKKIKQIVLLLVLILPVIINADTYDVEVNKANDLLNKKNYINTYQKFIKYGSDLKFEYSNGTNKTNSSFSKGGFISLDEYNLTTVRGVSYLFDGVEYWTLSKNGDNVYAIVFDNMEMAKNKNLKYNGRVTEFVNPNVTVHGTGKMNNPWTFDPVYRLTAVTDSRFATIESGNDQYIKGGCVENECTARVIIREKTGYRYISNNCNGIYDKITKTLIVNNLKKDTQCNVTFGRGITSYTNPIIRQVSQTVKSGYTYATSRTIGITYNNTNVENAKYYFKSSVAATVASGVIVESCGTSVNPGTCTSSNVTTLSAGTWYRTTNANPSLVYAANGTLYASMGDLIGVLGTSSFEITKVDSNTPGVPQIRYNGGSNTCTWKNNYSLTLSSTVFSGIHHYEIDWNGDGNPDNTSIDLSGVYIPTNNFNSHNTRFRAISNSGKASDWTEGQHIHMDTENPRFVSWNFGEVSALVAKLNINVTDNAGIPNSAVVYDGHAAGVYCKVSTQSGGYTNWHTFNGTWDNEANLYRCEITPSTFEHYGETYKVQLYVYDYASNGKYYTETTVNIPSLTYAAIPNTETFDATATTSSHCSEPGGFCIENPGTDKEEWYCVPWGFDQKCNDGTPPDFNRGYGPGGVGPGGIPNQCNCGKWVPGPATYSCPDGATLNGTKCTIITYTCPYGGTLDITDKMCK